MSSKLFLAFCKTLLEKLKERKIDEVIEDLQTFINNYSSI